MKKNNYRIIAVILIITLMISILSGCNTSKVSTKVDINSDIYKKIDEVVTKYNEKGNFSGSILVSKNGKVVYKKGFGTVKAKDFVIENDTDTKFLIYSLTKAFTAMLTLQLVEEGKLNLDDKINDVLPKYKNDKWDGVTIYHLLTHTSGIPCYTRTGLYNTMGTKQYSKDEIVEHFSQWKLHSEPGTECGYSNSNYFLLGLLIEKTTEKPYGEVLQEKICNPLGMKNTGYYDSEGKVKLINHPFAYVTNYYSAGGLYSTVEDLYLWDQALYTDKLLSKEYRDRMFKPFIDGYGCGWGITKTEVISEEKTIIRHYGSPVPDGIKTSIIRVPEDNIAVITLVNKRYLPLKLLDEISWVLYGIKPPTE